jgi:hypothetical protein
VRQIVQQNRVPAEGEIAYRFNDNGAIKTLWINAQVRMQLASGSLMVVRHDQGYALVPRAAAEKIHVRDAAMIVLDHGRSSAEDSADGDDEYYKQFRVRCHPCRRMQPDRLQPERDCNRCRWSHHVCQIEQSRFRQPFELGVRHPHHIGVRAGIEGDFRAAGQAGIDIYRYAVEVAERRHRANFAIRKGVLELVLMSKFYFASAQCARQAGEVGPVRSRHHHHCQCAVDLQHHGLGEIALADMRGIGGFLCGNGAVMSERRVWHVPLVEEVVQAWREHDGLRSGAGCRPGRVPSGGLDACIRRRIAMGALSRRTRGRSILPVPFGFVKKPCCCWHAEWALQAAG